MLYIHGGAYFFGSVDEHRYQMQRHARKLQARVFAPRYRLAPQFPFPCGLQDCLAAYLYLLSLHEPAEIILAGDSAGGGMVVSIMCLLRDQGLPLPAGAILISPWVDLTHSFPSLVGSAELDYIPSHGFMHKPSMAWPPPNDHELSIISALANSQDAHVDIDKAAAAAELHSGFSEHKLSDLPEGNGEDLLDAPKGSVPVHNDGAVRPASQQYLSVELDGKRIILKDQIQMYTTNQLLAHPLVSPVLQPSLGGLPPVLILTGGGELLRDEQIYLAHKMANPSAYPLGSFYRSRYDPDDGILKKYRPTPVQLQVWEDLCHVATTLSFTRPAKFMYRSVAQFGAWALARAQRRAIEIMDDDDVSIVSSETDSEFQAKNETGSSSGDTLGKIKFDSGNVTGSVGRAGDPLPPFASNMIRQRVDRHGRTYPLGDVHELPALQLAPDEVGVLKAGPVRNWLEARKRWDTKYASVSTRVRKERIRALASGEIKGFETGERPPPSALAARRTHRDLLPKKKRTSFGLAMWSNWGSKHDESTMRREEDAVEAERIDKMADTEAEFPAGQDGISPADPDRRSSSGQSRIRSISISRTRSLSKKRRTGESRPRGRGRTVSVTDTGQTEGRPVPSAVSMPPTATQEASTTIPGQTPSTSRRHLSQDAQLRSTPDPALLSAGFLPKFKNASHLRDDSDGGLPLSDAASHRTGRSGLLASDDASTRAVFAASGVSKNIDRDRGEEGESDTRTTTNARPGSPLATVESKWIGSEDETTRLSGQFEDGTTSLSGQSEDEAPTSNIVSREAGSGVQSRSEGGRHALSPAPTTGRVGSDTPRSQRSLERLHSHQQDEGMGRMHPLRSLSSTAVVRADGVVGVVDDDASGYDGGPDGHAAPNGQREDLPIGEREGGEDPSAVDRKEEDQELETTRDGIGTSVDGDALIANPNHAGPDSDKRTTRPKLYDRTDTTFRTAVEQQLP